MAGMLRCLYTFGMRRDGLGSDRADSGGLCLLYRGRMIKVRETKFRLNRQQEHGFAYSLDSTNGDHIDGSGRVWSQDRHFSGGTAFSRPEHLIFGTREQKIFRSGREGDFRYDIPLNPGRL